MIVTFASSFDFNSIETSLAIGNEKIIVGFGVFLRIGGFSGVTDIFES